MSRTVKRTPYHLMRKESASVRKQYRRTARARARQAIRESSYDDARLVARPGTEGWLTH